MVLDKILEKLEFPNNWKGISQKWSKENNEENHFEVKNLDQQIWSAEFEVFSIRSFILNSV